MNRTKQDHQPRSNKIEAGSLDHVYNLQIRNELNETADKLNRLSKQKKLLNSYRSSI